MEGKCPRGFRFPLSVWGDACTLPFPLPARRQRHCGQTLSLSETMQSISQPCLSPSSPASCPLHPAFISWVFFIPTEANTSWQKRPPGAHIHLRARERGVPDTIPSMCPPSFLIISSATPSLPQPAVNTSATHPCCHAAICWVVGTCSSVLSLNKDSCGILVPSKVLAVYLSCLRLGGRVRVCNSSLDSS